MRILRKIHNTGQIKRPVVTVGSFDGVHEGHRAILRLVNEEARRRGGESVVVTFNTHPRFILEDGRGLNLLNSVMEKAALLENEGVDNLIVIDFTRELSLLSSEEFIRDYLIGLLRMDTLMVGYNHHMGRNKEGDFDNLAELGKKYGFNIVRMPNHTSGGQKISSTVIRDLISGGDMELAAKYLGYPYSLYGSTEESGMFISDDPLKLIPAAGRYPVSVEQDGITSGNFIVIGLNGNITFEDKKAIKPGEITVNFRTFAEI